MKIYKDKGLKEEVKNLDLGIVDAGESKDYTYYILNDSKAEWVNLNISIDHPEISIKESVKGLVSGGVGKLVISWTPSITLKEGLKTRIKIKGGEIWSSI